MSVKTPDCTCEESNYEDSITAAVNKLAELGLIEAVDPKNSELSEGMQAVCQPTCFGLDVIECMAHGMSDDDAAEIVNAAAGC